MNDTAPSRADLAALSDRAPSAFRGCFFAVALAALFALALACLVAAATGCASAPPRLPSGTYDFATNVVLRLSVALREASTQCPEMAEAGATPPPPSGAADAPEGEAAAEAAPSAAVVPSATGGVLQGAAPSAPASPRLVYRYGSFDGGKAAESPSARIRGLKVSASGMSYAWEKGGCEDLGASSASDYSKTLACAFWWSEQEQAWIGGKFDWISTSRTTRDWKNVRERYNGWDPDAFFAAKRHAFCIVSADGRRRTNVIVQEGGVK